MLANPKSSLPPVEGEGEGPSWLGRGKPRDVCTPPDAPAGLAEQVGSQQAFLRFAASWVSVKTQEVVGSTGACGRISLALVCFYLPGTFPLPGSFSYELHSLEMLICQSVNLLFKM